MTPLPGSMVTQSMSYVDAEPFEQIVDLPVRNVESLSVMTELSSLWTMTPKRRPSMSESLMMDARPMPSSPMMRMG